MISLIRPLAPVGDEYSLPDILSPLNFICSTIPPISNCLDDSTVKYLLELFQSETLPVTLVPSDVKLSTSSSILKSFGCRTTSNCGNHLLGINIAAD